MNQRLGTIEGGEARGQCRERKGSAREGGLRGGKVELPDLLQGPEGES